jgi:hypothetical protein
MKRALLTISPIREILPVGKHHQPLKGNGAITMIIKGNNEFNKPFARFRDTGDGGPQLMQLRDRDHTPYNKRPGSVKSMLAVEASRYMPWDGPTEASRTAGDSIGISFEEITTSDNGRQAGRTISHQFPIAEALKLAEFILQAAAKNEDYTVKGEAARIASTIASELGS